MAELVAEWMRAAIEREHTQQQLQHALRLEAVGQLTGGVAHDFNNLLAVMMGALEIMQGEGAEPEYIEMALQAAERGASLTHQLLAFSRKQPLAPKVLQLNELLGQTSKLLGRTLPETIKIETVLAGGLWPCRVDEGQLQMALINLAFNARDAMPDGGKLTIEVGNARLDEDYTSRIDDLEAGQYVMIAVTDTGHGMSDEVAKKAFEPFFTTKGPQAGSGLGLSMIYGFIKQSGGHVVIYSEPDHGTTVRLYLPRAGEVECGPRSLSEAAPSEAVSESVFVVEDDEHVRALTVRLLRAMNYRVRSAAGAEEALEALGADPRVDLLLTDVVLASTMNGRQLAREVQRRHPTIRVLFMSGYTANAIVHNGQLDEDAPLLQKPFRKNELARRVRDILTSAKGA